MRRGLATAAGGTAVGLLAGRPSPAAASWPARSLTDADARRVDPMQFMSVAQLREWQAALDDIGLRATGSAVHAQCCCPPAMKGRGSRPRAITRR
jgi:hypothetical protein